MPETRTESIDRSLSDKILTLSEAASLLRVDEAPLAELALRGAVPAQKIGAEWRFLESAVLSWLRLGPRFHEILRFLPQAGPLEAILIDRLDAIVEQRLLSLRETDRGRAPLPGSKEAVRRHFGTLQNSGDLEKVLAGLPALRDSGVGSGE